MLAIILINAVGATLRLGLDWLVFYVDGISSFPLVEWESPGLMETLLLVFDGANEVITHAMKARAQLLDLLR
jgi:hypothetical protein